MKKQQKIFFLYNGWEWMDNYKVFFLCQLSASKVGLIILCNEMGKIIDIGVALVRVVWSSLVLCLFLFTILLECFILTKKLLGYDDIV